MYIKKLVPIFLAFGFLGTASAASMPKILGVSVGSPLCEEGVGRVIIESGELRLVDTVLADSSYIAIDKVLATRELKLSGFIVCEANTILLDEIISAHPANRSKIELGSRVTVLLDSVYAGNSSRKLLSNVDTELEFKRFQMDRRQKREKIKNRAH